MIEGGTEEQQQALAQVREQEEQEQKQLIKAAQIAKIMLDTTNAEKNRATTGKTEAEKKQIMVETAIDIEQATEPNERQLQLT